MSNEDGNGGLVKKKEARLDQELGNPTVYPVVIGAFNFPIGAFQQIESLKLQAKDTLIEPFGGLIAQTSFDIDWDDVPPTPTWNPPDNDVEASFDTGWEDIP